MRPVAVLALGMVLPLAAAAGQQDTAPPVSPTAKGVEQQAGAYAKFILGHINYLKFSETGIQQYATEAIADLKAAEGLDPEAVDIPLELARTYADAQRWSDAEQTAEAILKAHPENLAAHQLLARIYVRQLDAASTDAEQQHAAGLAAEQYEAVLKLDPANTGAGLALAQLYRMEKQPASAAKVLEQILSRDATDERALSQYTQLLMEQGHADQAIARLSAAAAADSSGRLYELLGDAYTQLHETDQAVKAYRQSAQLQPDIPTSWRRLAQTLFDENRFSEAAAAYRHLTEIDPNDSDNYVRLAEIDYQLKNFDQAETEVKKAKSLAPDDLEVLYSEALIAGAQGRYDDAIASVSKAIANLKQSASDQPASPRVYGDLYDELGELYRQQGNYPAALDAFHQMMALGPAQDESGRFEVIETYRQSRRMDQALQAAQQAMAAYPQSAQFKVAYANLLAENRETDQAVKLLQGLLTGGDGDRQIYLALAQVQEVGRRYADAEKSARIAEGMSRKPEDKVTVWFLLGAIYEQQKKYSDAESLFAKALQVDPNNDEVLNDYGYMLAEQGVRLGEAAEMLQRAVAQKPNNGAYLDSLGWAYYKQNRLTDARTYLLKALIHSPDDPTILSHLAEVYDRLGQTPLAIATWEKSLAEWRRALPADYDAGQVRDVQRKLDRAKTQAARGSHTAGVEPH